MRYVAIAILLCLSASAAQATLIIRDVEILLGDLLYGDTPDGRQFLDERGIYASAWADDPAIVDLGDTLRLNVDFGGQRLQMFDFGDPSREILRLNVQTGPGPGTISGAVWTSTIDFAAFGNATADPHTFTSSGGGVGIGYITPSFIDLTPTQFSFSGFQLDLTPTSSLLGFPEAFTGFGFSAEADRIAIRPVPEPGTLSLLAVGLLGMAFARRRRSASQFSS